MTQIWLPRGEEAFHILRQDSSITYCGSRATSGSDIRTLRSISRYGGLGALIGYTHPICTPCQANKNKEQEPKNERERQ